jgi:hypothetical protein
MFTEQLLGEQKTKDVLTIMDICGQISDLIKKFYYASNNSPCALIELADSALQLAYAAGEYELADNDAAVELKAAGLQLRHHAVLLASHKIVSDKSTSYGKLHTYKNAVAVPLRQICEAVAPELIPYFNVTIVCT